MEDAWWEQGHGGWVWQADRKKKTREESGSNATRVRDLDR